MTKPLSETVCSEIEEITRLHSKGDHAVVVRAYDSIKERIAVLESALCESVMEVAWFEETTSSERESQYKERWITAQHERDGAIERAQSALREIAALNGGIPVDDYTRGWADGLEHAANLARRLREVAG